MNPNGYRNFRFNISGLSSWLVLLGVVWLLGSIGLGWLVKSLFILFVLLLAAPIVGVLVFRWWLQRNLVEGDCPVCSQSLAGINKMQLTCPNCGEPLKIEQGSFRRITPPGVVDVDAIEVSVRQIDESSDR